MNYNYAMDLEKDIAQLDKQRNELAANLNAVIGALNYARELLRRQNEVQKDAVLPATDEQKPDGN